MQFRRAFPGGFYTFFFGKFLYKFERICYNTYNYECAQNLLRGAVRPRPPERLERGVFAMPGLSAVVFIPDDTGKTGYSRPMMLQNIMGTPLLAWLASSLIDGGVGRFFLVCHDRFRRDVRACFPDDVDFWCPSAETTSDQLHVFLSTADEKEEDIIVVTGPAVLLPFAADDEQFDGPPVASNVTSVRRAALMDALDDKFIFTEFLKDHGTPYTDRDGVYSIAGTTELADWQPVLNRAKLYRLAKLGVEIWDYGATYVDPTVSVGTGTALLPGTILRGQTSIGKNCTIGPNSYLENARVGDDSAVNASQIYNSSVGYDTHVGPFAYIRPGTSVGNRVRVGDFVELKNSNIGDGTKISHLTYVGDSDVGKNINFGCGTVTVNYDRAKKYRTVIEDNAFIGCNTNLVAPVTVGEGAYIAAGSTITDDIPAMALAIARARQANKKDWAAKHKLKEK